MADPAVREKARDLFVVKGLGVDTILKMLDGEVSRKTLYNWKNEDRWEELRRNEMKKAETLKEDLYELTRQAVAEAKTNLNPRTIFAVAKLLTALKQAQQVSMLEEPEESAESNKPKGISQETINRIKREVLGIEE